MLFLQEENPAKAEKNDHKNGILNHKTRGTVNYTLPTLRAFDSVFLPSYR